MKRIVLLILLMCGLSAMAQNYQDCVYLKNGGIMKGTVVSQDGNSVTLVTAGGSQYVFQMSEISKISKEKTSTQTYSFERPVMPLKWSSNFLSKQVDLYEGEKEAELTDAQIRRLLGQNYSSLVEAKAKFAKARGWEYASLGSMGVMFASLFVGISSLSSKNDALSNLSLVTTGVSMVTGLTTMIVGVVLDRNAQKQLDTIINDYNEGLKGKGKYGLNVQVSPYLAIVPNETCQPSGFAPGVSVALSF